jgi:Cu/Ag efflux protein CusF
MRSLLPLGAAATLAFAPAAHAQPRAGAFEVDAVEAVVTVTKVDPQARTVTIRGPRGDLATLRVPDESQNLDQVKPGARFRMTYTEAAAITITKGGKPSAGADEKVQLAPKGATPGGFAVRRYEASGVVDAVDYFSRYVTIRGPKGRPQSFRVASSFEGLEQINGGDRITVTYVEALAFRMLPAAGGK